jgi:transcription elongation factor GreB
MKTPLITPEGLEKLKAELDHLWRVERTETTQKVAWAASLGDRSENADYHYNKKRLREIDRRVLYLRKCIDDLKVVNYSPFQEGKVLFGAWVEIENDKGAKKRFRIVGYDEIFDTKDYTYGTGADEKTSGRSSNSENRRRRICLACYQN